MCSVQARSKHSTVPCEQMPAAEVALEGFVVVIVFVFNIKYLFVCHCV